MAHESEAAPASGESSVPGPGLNPEVDPPKSSSEEPPTKPTEEDKVEFFLPIEPRPRHHLQFYPVRYVPTYIYRGVLCQKSYPDPEPTFKHLSIDPQEKLQRTYLARPVLPHVKVAGYLDNIDPPAPRKRSSTLPRSPKRPQEKRSYLQCLRMVETLGINRRIPGRCDPYPRSSSI